MTAEASSSNVLVTGGSGFLGGHLARRLLADGLNVRLLVRNPDGLSAELAQQCEIIHGDLTDRASLLRAVSDVMFVYHCAANVKTWDKWEAYYEANVVGVRNLLHAVADSNPSLQRLIHVSSVDVYGYPESPSDELAETSGAGFGYGESKLQGEEFVRQFCQSKNIPFTIVRPANIIGPGSQFIERMGQELKSGLMLKIDSGRANAGLIYVENLLDYMVWAANADAAVGECYNLRDAYDVTWSEFVAVLRAAVGGRGLIINLPFGLAMALARLIQFIHQRLSLRGEPLLHPLLVNVFGRTCGHDASKIRAHSGQVSQVGFLQAMRESTLGLCKRPGTR